MSFFKRISRANPTHSDSASLLMRVHALEASLAKANKANRLRLPIAVFVAIAMFLSGIALGRYGSQVFSRANVPLGTGDNAGDEERGRAAFDRGDYKSAMRILLPLAAEGNSDAQVIVGEIFYHAQEGQRDDAQALKWFELAADKDHPVAQLHLGEMYSQGHGLPQDVSEGVKWYQLAAEQGHPKAQYNLGIAFAKGNGVPLDRIKAHMWFNLSTARLTTADSSNRALAMKNRDFMAGQMTQEELSSAQGFAREWKPRSRREVGRSR